MKEILIPFAVVGGLGLLFGLLLAYASVVFAVKQDKRIDEIQSVLPGANCGACGFAGCSAYASAIVQNGAEVNLCSVGKEKVAKEIANIMGVEAGAVVEKVAHVKCNGNCQHSPLKFDYVGVATCESLSMISGGPKHCRNACIGFGSCANVCKFGAISVVDGVAVVDVDKCTGCGACVRSCPRNVIEMIPLYSKLTVNCSNTEKGPDANRHCKSSCIGCKMCEKACEHDAIHVENNIATIDYDKCIGCGKCALKCPKKVINIKEVVEL